MRSPAAAIGWELWSKHRWGLTAIAGYVLTMAALNLLQGTPIETETEERFVATIMLPLTFACIYFIAIFCYGLAGDIGARQSIFPARMFTLPISTTALAGWPMLYGTVAVMSLWFASATLAHWPSWFEVPLVWPAFFGAAFLAWTQALMWMPYGLPGFRPLIAVSLLITADAIVILAVHYEIREAVMVAAIAPFVPLGYLAGRYAVGLARGGGVADWRERFARGRETAGDTLRAVRPFSSADRAQLWFEWRRCGRALPLLVAIVLPFELGLMFLPGATYSPGLVFYPILVVLLTPRFMGAFTALTIRSANPLEADASAMPAFMAARPMTTAALIAAKLRMAILSTIAAWLLVLAAIPLAIYWSGTWPIVRDGLRDTRDIIGQTRLIALAVLVVLVGMVSTWKQLVQGLSIGLTGRDWLIRINTFVTLCLTVAVVPFVARLIRSGDLRATVWEALPLTVTVLVVIKMVMASWIATRLYAARVVTDRTLVTGAAVWVAVVLASYGGLAWLIEGTQMARYFLLLVAILLVPLGRLSAAPLALAWNRHR